MKNSPSQSASNGTHVEPVSNWPEDFDEIKDAPFVPLGYDHGEFYYLASGAGQVLCLNAAHHNAVANLLQLAPHSFWKQNFAHESKINYAAVCDYLFRMQERVGPYDPSRIRGRGPWWHDGRVVIHVGDRIILGVEGGGTREIKPHEMPGNYIYERSVPIHITMESPLHASRAVEFLRLMESLSWQKAIYAKYVAGWCVAALIGGALAWRPHLWCTGAKGTGKTTVMTQIIRPILGENCRFFLSSTSEAGIRQTLKRDSLPVIFDEAEGEDQRARDRLQNILSLVRQSSSDTQGMIAKGTPSGDANTYDIRSCFAFSSINASLMQASDQSRVTVCELTKFHSRPMEDLSKDIGALLTDEFINALYARSIQLVPVIRENAKTFGIAVRTALGEQRAGDQLGVLLAGAYALGHDGTISSEDAARWVGQQDWSENKADIEGMSDEQMCYRHIMQKTIWDGEIQRSIGEMLDIVAQDESAETDKHREKYHRFLMQNGVRYVCTQGDVKCVAISNNHTALKKILEDTAWGVRWNKILLRLKGAIASEEAIYFGAQGSKARAVLIPLEEENG